MPDEDLTTVVDTLMAQSLVQQAQIEVLLDLNEAILKQLGSGTLDGLSVRDWWMKEKREKLEQILIHLEDKNPTTAAFLQKIIDDAREKNG